MILTMTSAWIGIMRETLLINVFLVFFYITFAILTLQGCTKIGYILTVHKHQTDQYRATRLPYIVYTINTH
jgi:hypothetical protein